MSQGPSAPRPSASQRHNDRYKTLPPLESRTLPPISDGIRSAVSMNAESGTCSTKMTPAQSPVDQKPSRPIGVQSILNPTGRDGFEVQGVRRKAEHFDLPSPATTVASRAPSSSMTPSPGSVSLPSITSPSMGAYLPSMGHGPRQILTPRSTSSYTPNVAVKNMSNRKIDAQKSPFIGSSDTVTFNGPESQSVEDTRPGSALTSSFGSSAPDNRSPTDRRFSGGPLAPGLVERRTSLGGGSQAPGSLSNSPSTTYSSYSHFSRTPPASQPAALASQPYFGPRYSGPGAVSTLPQGYSARESYGPTTTSMGQSTYPMMAFDTEQGPIQVPVDVQAASKIADEKRKRNATASHRFRQRRKEKERETSQNIANLKHQVHEIAKEREFYRQERDFFRSLVPINGSPSHIPARPPSPRQAQVVQTGEEDVYGNGMWQHSDDGSQMGRNTRRRTSSYISPQEVPQPLTGLPASQPQHYTQPHHESTQGIDLHSTGSQSASKAPVRGRQHFNGMSPSRPASNWQARR